MIVACRFFFIFILGLGLHFSFAQIRFNYSTNNQDAIELYEQAVDLAARRQYKKALELLNKALEKDDSFIEVIDKLGSIHRRLGNTEEAIKYYTLTYNIDPQYNSKALYYLGLLYFNNEQYEEAIKMYEKFYNTEQHHLTKRDEFVIKKLIEDCQFAPEAKQNPIPFVLVNLGANINSKYDEYLPSLTADGQQLLFTRKTEKGEDFYSSSLNKSGKWGKAKFLSSKINTPQYNEGAQSLSIDGKLLFFTGCNRKDGLGRCDIYVARKKGNEWSRPENIGYPVNTQYWESQPSISSDGKTLYFASNRKGGKGGYDIWQSTRLEDGSWSEPQNMGSNINTPLNEQSPFIHPDNETFYFSSDGFTGMGKEDIFISRLGENGKWGKPKNIGYPLNSNRDDFGLIISTDGQRGYYASAIESDYGGFDIFYFELPQKIKPQKVTYVKGKIIDVNTNKPVEVDVEITDALSEKKVYDDKTDANTGEFISVLEIDKKYIIKVINDDLVLYSEELITKDEKYPPQLIIKVPIIQKVSDKSDHTLLDSETVFFDFNDDNIDTKYTSTLDTIVKKMQANTELRSMIEGYTDYIGSSAYNLLLSNRRAKAVYDFLIKKGIEADKLTYKGLGEFVPNAQYQSVEERRKSRKVVVRLFRANN